MRSQLLDVPSKAIIDRIHPQMNEFRHSILNMRMRDEWKRGRKPSVESDFNDLMTFLVRTLPPVQPSYFMLIVLDGNVYIYTRPRY
jgi:hypothetical protein